MLLWEFNADDCIVSLELMKFETVGCKNAHEKIDHAVLFTSLREMREDNSGSKNERRRWRTDLLFAQRPK